MKFQSVREIIKLQILSKIAISIFLTFVSINTKSAPATFPVCNNFSVFILANFLNGSLGAAANMVLLEDAKKIVNTCPTDFFDSAKEKFVFSREAFDKKVRELPDQVISEIADPKATPYAVLEGDLGERIRSLNKNFKLSPTQLAQLNSSIKKARERTRTLLSDVDKNCDRIDFRPMASRFW